MISVFGSSFDEREAEAVAGALRDQWTGKGARTAMFEDRFAQERGLTNFQLLNSGSNALFLALRVLDLPKGSEVILPAFTWVACAQAVVENGLVPVFCDVEEDTQNASARTIADRITDRSSAIMVVHYAGLPVEMDPILDLGLPVIEDAAHAVCSSLDGRSCGSMGDVGVFSFDAIKNLAIGNAGGVTFRSEDHAKMARDLAYCGVRKSGFENAADGGSAPWWEYEVAGSFFKAVPDDISAAIGLVQLDKLQRHQQIRNVLWARYDERLSRHERVRTPVDHPSHSRFTYFVRVPQRDELARHLLQHQVYTTLRYQPLTEYPVFGPSVPLSNTDLLAREGLNLPIHPRLTVEDVDRVCDLLIDFLDRTA